ncbi:DUF6401 family natural product biosynthesis protein [Nocardia lasii]|uniref:DUF6401 family natural product biosynthesis protein n=1 Tax=Nocardia lasii TaxID=1616107 RepID=A0ABW1JYC0_9NOCA
MFAPGHALLELSALRQLRQLNIDYGLPAATAAAENPALLAELDQHAAAVRDIIEYGVEDSDRIPRSILLAGYLGGLRDGAGTEFADAPHCWREPDWLSLRLAAICRNAALTDERRPTA